MMKIQNISFWKRQLMSLQFNSIALIHVRMQLFFDYLSMIEITHALFRYTFDTKQDLNSKLLLYLKLSNIELSIQ